MLLDCDYRPGSRVHKECESICDESADFISSLQEIVARDVSVRNVIWNGSPGPRGSPANSCSRGSRSSSRSSRTMRRRDRSAAHLSDPRAKMPLDFDAPQQRGAVVCRPADVNATARFPVARHPPSLQPMPPPALHCPNPPLSWESFAVPVFPDSDAPPLYPYDLSLEQPPYVQLCPGERSALSPAPDYRTHISRSPALPVQVTPPFRSDVVEWGSQGSQSSQGSLSSLSPTTSLGPMNPLNPLNPLEPPFNHICIPQVDKQTLRRLSTSYHKGPKGANLFVYYLPSYISSEDLALFSSLLAVYLVRECSSTR